MAIEIPGTADLLYMEQRREVRFATGQSVMLTLLRDQQVRVPARVINASGRGLGLVSPHSISPGTALKIELDDSLVLGEAVYCRREADSWFVGVELNQVLAGLAELGRRLQEFAPLPLGGQGVDTMDYRHAQNR